MKIHFIAIGGSAMHNMAIALKDKGLDVSGSDDEIREPSLSRLKKKNILPSEIGWFPEKLSTQIDAVILGMHARADNPELIRAKELGLKIYSYPEYIYEQTKDKIRVVVGGSHGKTTITAMILHVLTKCSINCDYMVGAQLAGFDTMVKLTHEAKIAIIEGDEYLASPIDRRPKFHLYHPNIAIISGIAWDHINVFPTFEMYVDQFTQFINLIEPKGTLVYCNQDKDLNAITKLKRDDITYVPYDVPKHEIVKGITFLLLDNSREIALEIFGAHNLMNLNGALQVCKALGVNENDFYTAIASFKGAAKRLELVKRTETSAFYKDFAHSPSKLKATTDAVKTQYPNRRLIACMELHTFSSLNEDFLKEYEDSMNLADVAIVYYNPEVIAHKKLKPINEAQVKSAFNRNDLVVVTKTEAISKTLKDIQWNNTNLLMMSSGNFDGIDFAQFAEDLF